MISVRSDVRNRASRMTRPMTALATRMKRRRETLRDVDWNMVDPVGKRRQVRGSWDSCRAVRSATHLGKWWSKP
ncbi:hypothetical protein D9M69_651250 [compost metagenome]